MLREKLIFGVKSLKSLSVYSSVPEANFKSSDWSDNALHVLQMPGILWIQMETSQSSGTLWNGFRVVVIGYVIRL